MQKLNVVGLLAKFYEEKPVVQAGAQLIPFVGPLDKLLLEEAARNERERAAIFFEELDKEGAELTPELVQSEEFVHRFVITAKAAVGTRRQEKIRLFARLLSHSFTNPKEISTDMYEEYLRVLDDMSYREFLLLETIADFEASYPVQPNQSRFDRARSYQENFRNSASRRLRSGELDLRSGELDAMLLRLNRTGCYKTFNVSALDYEGNVGELTAMYTELKHLIREKAVKPQQSDTE